MSDAARPLAPPNRRPTAARRGGTIRVLVLSPTVPVPHTSGFATRAFELTRGLARTRDVTVLALATDPHDGGAALGDRCAVRTFARRAAGGSARRLAQARSVISPLPYSCHDVYVPELQQELDRLCMAEAVDVVLVESAHMLEYRVPPGPAVVLDEHNIEYELFARLARTEPTRSRRWYNWLEHGKFRRIEPSAWRKADGVAVTSRRDLDTVAAVAPRTPARVVPNGVDLSYFRPDPTPVVPHSVAFVGLLRYRPNLDAAIHLVDDILPRLRRSHPDSVVTIAGDGDASTLARLRRSGAEVTGFVPDIRPLVNATAVVAVPLRAGSGTRLKVVESLAMGKAVVSTRLGCEGIDLIPGEHLLVADGAPDFADAIGRLFDDPALGTELGRRGRQLAESDYSWSRAVDALEDLITTPA